MAIRKRSTDRVLQAYKLVGILESHKHLIVVAGPTAVGKTAVGIELAKHFDCEIISADSRQFYKEISIGTAKPNLDKLGAVHHHFINSHSIVEEYNAGRYEKDALSLLEEIHTKKDLAIMVGGSGLFIQAVTSGFDELPEIDPKIREFLNLEVKTNGLECLLGELKDIDPEYFNIVDISNQQRVIRALEVIRATSIPYSQYRKNSPKPRPFSIIKIGLEQDRKELYERIDLRVDQMLNAGLLEEVKSVIAYRDKPALKTVGYSEIFDFLDGKQSLEEAVSLIKRNSRRYAKRQLTWFKKDQAFNWFLPDQIEDIKSFIKKQIEISNLY